MSVLVTRGDGPSYIMHEPAPGRGPAVCAKCVHVRDPIARHRGPKPEFCESWTCAAAPVEIKRQAGTDPLTGEHVPAVTVGTRCTARNKTGECPDFDSALPDGSRASPERLTDAEIADDLPARVAILALGFVLGGGLMAWLGGGS
jgi:hypothetical protein